MKCANRNRRRPSGGVCKIKEVSLTSQTAEQEEVGVPCNSPDLPMSVGRHLMEEYVRVMVTPVLRKSFSRKVQSLLPACGFAVAGLLLSGLLSAQQVPIGPTTPPPQQSALPAPDKNTAPAPPPKAEGGAAVSADYKIGPADVLKIQVWSEDKFSGLFTVDQDGRFVYPLIGELIAGGKTTAEVKESVEKSLMKYVVKPRVDVTVQEVQSKKYYLDGQVNHPGEYLLAVPTTILQAISKGGGLQDFANQKKIYVLRGSTKIPFNYKEVSQGKRMEQNIPLLPDDHVFVP